VNKYRKDLDGIRAIAVLLVLFFHVDIVVFKAGFIGVDIFFTISGFLISGIVLREVQTTGFSFKKFYIRRATRLLPAYLFMLIITLLASLYILAPLALFDFFKSALASSLFVSNFYFLFNHSGYFSTSVHELPLLHTWSLSVEEQFYLIMPLSLILWMKIKIFKIRFAVLLGCLVFSIFVSGFLTSFNQGLSYFLVPSRIHEFLFGTLLAVIINQFSNKITPSTFASNVLFVISILGIFLVSTMLSSKGDFPGYIASIVCLFTALLIYVGLNENCISHKVLGNRLFVWIGLLSYSIYLWHWPIVSLLKYMQVDFYWYTQLTIVMVSLFFAAISYYYVEKPFRYGVYSKNSKVALALYALPAVVLMGFVSFHSLLPSKFSQQAVLAELMTKSAPEMGREICHSKYFVEGEQCYLGDTNSNLNGLLWGDSHASHFAPFIDVYAKSAHLKVKDTTMGNCPAIVDASTYVSSVKSECLEKNSQVLNYIEQERPDNLFVASSWFGYVRTGISEQSTAQNTQKIIDGIVKTLNNVHQLGVSKVYFFTTVARPEKDLSHCFLKQLRFTNNNCNFQLNEKQVDFSADLRSKLSTLDFVYIVDVNTMICKKGICRTSIGDIPLYRDSNHLNKFGAQELAKLYMRKL
tara:strand:+ start:36518 stop:38428 length:1911 start_codon:yes stop_codon:yes gene_type:complete